MFQGYRWQNPSRGWVKAPYLVGGAIAANVNGRKSRLRHLRAEKVVLLPLLGGVIAGIICLVSALSRTEPPPAAEKHAAPLSKDHQPLRGPG
jgi:hypothetical protein